jgi:two-component system sensor histidine kinase VicK
MEFIGAYLLSSLEDYFLGSFADSLTVQAEQLSRLVSDQLENPDSQKLQELLSQVLGQAGRVLVLDDDGIIVAGSSALRDASGKRLPDNAVVMGALNGTQQERRTVDPDSGERFLEIYHPVVLGPDERVTGVIYVSASLEHIYQNLSDIRGIVFSATFVALGLVGVLAFLLARTIAAPIREITHRASLMAAGDFDQEIEIRSRDEVGQLGAMFNYLTHRLDQTLAEIAEEKQKAEAILVHMADGILALDRQGTIMLVNPAARKILRLQPDQELEGHKPQEVLEGLDIMPLVRRALLARKELSEQHRLENPERILQVHVTPLWSDDDDISGFVLVLQDITEQEKLEQLRREFVANVSHELRTPLTTIKSYVETLLEGALQDENVSKEFLDVVDSEADRMNRLVSDLLQLSKMDYLQLEWEWREVAVERLIDDVCSKLRAQAEDAGVDLSCEYSSGLEVYGDYDRLQQVLLNLGGNAMKFTPEGGKLAISAYQKDEEFVKVVVEDTGIGIPEEDLDRVFERFYRVDKARSRDLGGTGLGLAIAREIVEAHGGSIELTSTVGEGTRVAFTIPTERLELHEEEQHPLESRSLGSDHGGDSQ